MSTRGFATATAVVFLFCVLEPLETAAEQVERLKKCGNEFCTGKSIKLIVILLIIVELILFYLKKFCSRRKRRKMHPRLIQHF